MDTIARVRRAFHVQGWSGSEGDWKNWCGQLSILCGDVLGDTWFVDFGEFDKSLGSPQQTRPEGIISDHEHKLIIYLRNIDSLWNLGTWAFKDRALTQAQPFHQYPRPRCLSALCQARPRGRLRCH